MYAPMPTHQEKDMAIPAPRQSTAFAKENYSRRLGDRTFSPHIVDKNRLVSAAEDLIVRGLQR